MIQVSKIIFLSLVQEEYSQVDSWSSIASALIYLLFQNYVCTYSSCTGEASLFKMDIRSEHYKDKVREESAMSGPEVPNKSNDIDNSGQQQCKDKY